MTDRIRETEHYKLTGYLGWQPKPTLACDNCNGTGIRPSSNLGDFSDDTNCPICHGTGKKQNVEPIPDVADDLRDAIADEFENYFDDTGTFSENVKVLFKEYPEFVIIGENDTQTLVMSYVAMAKRLRELEGSWNVFKEPERVEELKIEPSNDEIIAKYMKYFHWNEEQVKQFLKNIGYI